MTQEEKEKIIAERANHDIVCFNEPCSRHESCLRWQMGRFAPEEQCVLNSISPIYRKYREGKCDMWRSAEIISMPSGMVHFYDEMPGRKEVAIKQSLIAEYGRKRYYRYRNGELPISPDVEAYIRRICKNHGWTAEPRFDTVVEGFAH